MTSLFFYGSLRHVPLLEIVLGRAAGGIDMQPATLPDHAVRAVAEGPFPTIGAEQGAETQGLLVRGLDPQDIARLDFYEAGFEFDTRGLPVETDEGAIMAQVYFPAGDHWTPGDFWSLQDWVDQWGQLSCDAAREVMGRYGKASPQEISALFPFIRSRAWARRLAVQPAPQTLRAQMTDQDVEITAERPGFDGFFRMRAFSLRHRTFAGGWSETMNREAFVAFDAALVLPYDPATDRVMLIEQMRYGPLMRGDPAPWVLEPVAGLVDAGETPEACARREAVEEAGLTLGEMRPMPAVYASPGYSSEFFHCFLGLCDLSPKDAGLGGLDTEHEDIRSHVLRFPAAMALLDSGEVNAGPLAMMLLWLARERPNLRSGMRPVG
ncbi:NUDIX domain-containing protein [Primorskyibacter flagellatus]|uniref:ADP-ribose pyrophosphatase n=1 Tax=Primorskyibacter flagellatus TaxID=1387277 RepID=A0A1W2BNK1_9RHOB|nr:gamma-glutamylcyclotransferase [Primorskyibacter flagellatus]SMC74414.1 nudix-type nucleoside diphosphatase, YffH/AdpP family [Primorskyibacter flagellatus]